MKRVLEIENRCLETIISKFNLYLILNSENSLIKLDFKLFK